MDTPDVTGPMNLGNPGEFTVAQLAQEVLALTGSRSPCVHLPLPADDPAQRRPDIRLAQDHLGWKPTVELREGLGRTIEWFRQEMARGDPHGHAVRAAA
jgi:UDP-glucuronate decarboxylase